MEMEQGGGGTRRMRGGKGGKEGSKGGMSGGGGGGMTELRGKGGSQYFLMQGEKNLQQPFRSSSLTLYWVGEVT